MRAKSPVKKYYLTKQTQGCAKLIICQFFDNAQNDKLLTFNSQAEPVEALTVLPTLE